MRYRSNIEVEFFGQMVYFEIEILFNATPGSEATRDHPGDDPEIEITGVNIAYPTKENGSPTYKIEPAPRWLFEMIEGHGGLEEALFEHAAETYAEELDRRHEAKYGS